MASASKTHKLRVDLYCDAIAHFLYGRSPITICTLSYARSGSKSKSEHILFLYHILKPIH